MQSVQVNPLHAGWRCWLFAESGPFSIKGNLFAGKSPFSIDGGFASSFAVPELLREIYRTSIASGFVGFLLLLVARPRVFRFSENSRSVFDFHILDNRFFNKS
jgi:hypothetical protein